MKKSIIVILLLAVAAAAGAFYVFQILPAGKKVSSLESLVSDDALFYTYSYNPDKKIKEFQASDFFVKLTKTSIYKTWIEPQINQFYQNAPLLSGFLQEDVAMAFFSLGNLQNPQGSIQDLGDFLILVRLNAKKHAQIKKQVFDAYLSVAGKGKMTSKVYKGIKINKYISLKPVFTINYAFIADVLVLSNNANVIQKSIDLYQKISQNSLAENSNFQSIKARIKKDPWAWGYQNNEAYNRQMFAYYASGALRSKSGRWAAYAVDPAQVAPIMELMSLMKVSGFSVERDILKEGFLWRGYYIIGEPKSKAMSEIAKFIAEKKPFEEEVLRLVPRDILMYVGMRKDVSLLWKFAKYSFARMSEAALLSSPGASSSATAQEASKQLKDGLAKLDSFLGLSIERDILPALGDDFGFIIANLENAEIDLLSPQAKPSSSAQGSFSVAIPQAYSYLELKDVAKIRPILEDAARKLVDKGNQKIKERERRWQETLNQQTPGSKEELIAQEEGQPLTLLKDTYQEAEIFYLELLNFPFAFFKPNYCFLDKYVIFSYSLPLTKKVIDVYKNKGDSFAKNPNFSSLKNKISAGYSDIAFFDIKRTIDQLGRVKFFDSILYQVFSSSNPRGVTKEQLDELLGVLSDVTSITSANRVAEQDALETDLYIKIKGL